MIASGAGLIFVQLGSLLLTKHGIHNCRLWTPYFRIYLRSESNVVENCSMTPTLPRILVFLVGFGTFRPPSSQKTHGSQASKGPMIFRYSLRLHRLLWIGNWTRWVLFLGDICSHADKLLWILLKTHYVILEKQLTCETSPISWKIRHHAFRCGSRGWPVCSS